MIRLPLAAALGLALLLLSGCGARLFDVNLFIVGEQTALERQVLGSYSALGEDLVLYSSVRGVDPDGQLRPPPPTTDSQRVAFAAMRNREYNRDDVDRFLAEGLVGEGRDGLLAWRAGVRAVGLLLPEQVETIVAEENADRQVLVQRLLETTTERGDGVEEQVRWIFSGLNRDAAPRGAWVEARDGEWRRKR